MNFGYMDTYLYSEHDLLRLEVDEAIERMGDKETYLEISRYFADHLPDSVLKLHDALDSGDLQTAMRMAHSMKSNCATVGAESLRERCFTLEKLCREGELVMARELFAGLESHLLAMRDRLQNLH